MNIIISFILCASILFATQPAQNHMYEPKFTMTVVLGMSSLDIRIALYPDNTLETALYKHNRSRLYVREDMIVGTTSALSNELCEEIDQLIKEIILITPSDPKEYLYSRTDANIIYLEIDKVEYWGTIEQHSGYGDDNVRGIFDIVWDADTIKYLYDGSRNIDYRRR